MDAAEQYNKIRRIVFSGYHREGYATASEWLDQTYRRQLLPHNYVGLRAELEFYRNHDREFNLTVAGDMGEHADFAGTYQGQACRFDVTTNLSYKDFATYEKHMGNGPRYKIALLDRGNFRVIDVLDLAFELCPDCGGHLVPCIAMLPQNYNRHGEAQWTNDQLLMDVCTGCHQYIERQRMTTTGLLSPQEVFDALDDQDDSAPAMRAREDHMLHAYKFLRPTVHANLMALAEHAYHPTGPKGEGEWTLQMVFKNDAIATDLPDAIACEHEI